MKTMILSNSGNVGKSFLARSLFERLNCEKKALIEVETHNRGSEKLIKGVEKIGANEIKKLLLSLMKNECAVVDVGASNIVVLLENIRKTNKVVLSEIDTYIVPAKETEKALADALKTIETLRKIGISEEKIVLLGNGIEETERFKEAMKAVEKAYKGIRVPSPVPNFPSVIEIEALGTTPHALTEDQRDFHALAKEAILNGKEEEAEELAELALLQGAARTISEVLDAVFSEIFENEGGEK